MGADGEGVGVFVGTGVGVSVGVGVMVGVKTIIGVMLGVPARLVAMAACPVRTTTVGKYSGGNGVGADSTVVGAQAATSPSSEASRKKRRNFNLFICKDAPL
jgi:hypothetical protein